MPTTYKVIEWMHIKIVYAGARADIYIDADKPVLRVNNLKRDRIAGSIGINAANFASAYFSNVTVSKLADAYVLPGSPAPAVEVAEGLIRSWSVSEPWFFLETVFILPGLTGSGTVRFWPGCLFIKKVFH